MKLWSTADWSTWKLVHSEDLWKQLHSNEDALPSNGGITMETSQDVRTRHERHNELLKKQQEKSRTDIHCLRHSDVQDVVAVSFIK